MSYRETYTGGQLERIAFPLGGMGAGTICFDGDGSFSHVSLRHHPDLDNQPMLLPAVGCVGHPEYARVLQGQTPRWKMQQVHGNTAFGAGFPRFKTSNFQAQFPFATLQLEDASVPLRVTATAWSPFVPGDSDASSLPVAGVEYSLTSTADVALNWVFSFHAENIVAQLEHRRTVAEGHNVQAASHGFVLHQPSTEKHPTGEAAFAVFVDDASTTSDCAWFRGGWFDKRTILWQHVEAGDVVSNPPHEEGEPSSGASLYLPVTLEPGETKTVRLQFAWHVPYSTIFTLPRCEDEEQKPTPDECYRPWYSSQFEDVHAVSKHWQTQYDSLRSRSRAFTDCFYSMSLPEEITEAIAANLCILKSPTVMRQHDGKLWAWEGCADDHGCCAGTCTHVWNYAQAIPHLFPDMERSLRETEFQMSQNDEGHQGFRSALPIQPLPDPSAFHAAADGQLGGIMKLYREWRISGDTDWMKSLWPDARRSLEYCIRVWDPDGKGVLVEPHHNTYDIEFWGPDGMCSSFYLGALMAAIKMGEASGEDVSTFKSLCEQGRTYLEEQLFNGEYFLQDVQWQNLRAGDPTEASKISIGGGYSSEALALMKKEGPKYQYGKGCLADGVLGAWIAAMCAIDDDLLDSDKVRSHLESVYRYNMRHDLREHPNPQRPGYAFGEEGGLLLCTWPYGEQLSLPFVYSNEVWTGIEYQVASHLLLFGRVSEGLDIVRTARARYDGEKRNPFNEIECGAWYARAMASYGLLQALTGVRYDAVDKTLHIRPNMPGDFVTFLATEAGFGHAGVHDGKPFCNSVAGEIDVQHVEYTPWSR